MSNSIVGQLLARLFLKCNCQLGPVLFGAFGPLVHKIAKHWIWPHWVPTLQWLPSHVVLASHVKLNCWSIPCKACREMSLPAWTCVAWCHGAIGSQNCKALDVTTLGGPHDSGCHDPCHGPNMSKSIVGQLLARLVLKCHCQFGPVLLGAMGPLVPKIAKHCMSP